jgi:hypothetical protein
VCVLGVACDLFTVPIERVVYDACDDVIHVLQMLHLMCAMNSSTLSLYPPAWCVGLTETFFVCFLEIVCTRFVSVILLGRVCIHFYRILLCIFGEFSTMFGTTPGEE